MNFFQKTKRKTFLFETFIFLRNHILWTHIHMMGWMWNTKYTVTRTNLIIFMSDCTFLKHLTKSFSKIRCTWNKLYLFNFYLKLPFFVLQFSFRAYCLVTYYYSSSTWTRSVLNTFFLLKQHLSRMHIHLFNFFASWIIYPPGYPLSNVSCEKNFGNKLLWQNMKRSRCKKRTMLKLMLQNDKKILSKW